MGLDQAVTGDNTAALVAGIGFRREAAAGEIEALIRQGLAEIAAEPGALRMIATALDRCRDPALCEAAAAFSLTPAGFDAYALAACDDRAPTRSERILTLRGVGSLSETAALAGAGSGGRLAGPRIASGSVTCALAFCGKSRDGDRP